MKKHSKKLLSLFLAAALTVTFSMPVSAEEETPLFDSSVAAELESVAAELDSLEPGTDYVDKEGVFIADTREEAERLAAQYNGTLKSYNHRIAVVQFKESTVDAFRAAAHIDSTDSTNSPNSPEALIEPNYIYHTMDVENDISVSDSNIFSMGHLESTLTNDPYADSTNTYYQYFHEKINTLKAHETTTGKGAKIAVIDSGCTPDHEDSAFDDEHSLHIDSLSSGTDTTDGHGIHCTGIIHEKKGNSLGGFGVAPDAEIYSVKAFEADTFPTSVLLEALSIAIEKNVNVVSMSVGGPDSGNFQQLINEAYNRGIMIVASAGNETTSDMSNSYPAAYDHVLAVAATDSSDALANYSNYGDWVDVAAPGSYITSTYLPGIQGSIAGSTSNQNAYGCISGTSMATPVVAGVAALCYAANPDILDMGSCDSVDYVTKAILDTTDGIEYTYSDRSVKGLVQADKAVEEIQKYAGSKTYTLVDEAGNYGALLRGNIAQGKKVKLKIGDLKGITNTKELKKALKNAKWTSSSSSVTVKNGVVKCDKKAVTDSEVTITAEYGGDTLQCKYTITKPLKAAGCYTTESNKKGGYKLKIKSTIKFDSAVKCGTEVDLISPYLNSEACLFFDTKYSTAPVCYSADSAFKYSVTFSKKDISKENITLVKNNKGRPVKAILNNPGKYTIKFKTIDGSNKTFTYKLEVE